MDGSTAAMEHDAALAQCYGDAWYGHDPFGEPLLASGHHADADQPLALLQPALGHAPAPLPLLHTAWPSQLTNPTPTPAAAGYAATGPSLAPDAARPPDKTPRKTLSAEQKRAMCRYHDENPGTRQADIGARFGVERR